MNVLNTNFKSLVLILLGFSSLLVTSCSNDQDPKLSPELSLQDQITNLNKTLAQQDTLTEKEVALLQNLKNYAGDTKASVSVGEQNHSFNFDDLSRTHIEFNSIEEPPVFASCESAGDPAAKKECVEAQVAKFVDTHFNLSAGKDLKVAGIYEIDVSFVIDTEGNIKDIKTRYAEPALEREAERVIANLPKMIPGKHKGKTMASLYSLPIRYKVPS